jgi:hypothetical protein
VGEFLVARSAQNAKLRELTEAESSEPLNGGFPALVCKNHG